jgi:penicillin amidase
MRFTLLGSVLVIACATAATAAADPAAGAPTPLGGLQAAASITRDTDGVYHIRARNEPDVFLMQGWLHARDRLFQMDQNRRLASGTLAELLGAGALPTDVQLRTIGLRRAAVRSLGALSPETRAALDAYAQGVNAWVAANPLPPEYGALELSHFEPWSQVDSLVIGKLIAFGLSFDLDIDATVALVSYEKAGQLLGFDGQKLFSEDLDRSAPFDPAATVPDASVAPQAAATRSHVVAAAGGIDRLKPAAIELARHYRDEVSKIPLFEGILDRNHRGGSNLWAVSGGHTTTGRPLIANDPHLALGTPSTFYPNGLEVAGGMEVFGSSFPGIPGVVLGYNKYIAWGSTNNDIDVTDTFQEQVVPDSTSPSGLSTLYLGSKEPIIPIPETFRVNQVGSGVPDDIIVIPPGGPIPAATLIVPRRNNGPIIQFDPTTLTALSVQYTGFSPTRELDAILGFNRASSIADFVAALQYFDFGSQNFVVADHRGDIAYFTSGEMPVREDLQAGSVNGLPPWFIRNGQGGNEWLPVQHQQPNQAVPYEVLPFAEMPKIVNPPAGWFVSSNNDPAGLTLDNNPLNTLRPDGGIFYLAYAWDRGFRAGRITQRLSEYLSSGDERISFEKMQSIQADVVLRDAEYFTPWIVAAFDRAQRSEANATLAALAADPGVAEAVARLRRWDRSTPSGLVEGWDAGKPAGVAPSQASIDASVAATVYSAWRGRFIANTVDAVLQPLGLPVPDSEQVLTALRDLLDNFPVRAGRGASGVNFFVVPGIANAEDRRDILLLRSVADALTLLAGDAFKPAFGSSPQQADYRWGKLHRIVFQHPLGGPFSIPPAGGAFPPPLAGLDGIPTDGAFQTVDDAQHDVRAASLDGFMFAAGPVRRFVGELGRESTRAESIWPGGTSGVLGSPLYAQFLPHWLANEAIPLHLGHAEVSPFAIAIEKFVPGAADGPLREP